MIVLLHFNTPGLISRSIFVKHGFLFVDFFFVLSGFVIAASYGERLAQGFSIAKFMALRLGRVYPLHLFMLMLFLTFELAFSLGFLGSASRQPFQEPNDLIAFAASVLLIQTFVGNDHTVWNGPSWSIAVEVWTYLIFAVAFRRAGRTFIVLSILVAALAAVYVALRTDRYLNVFHDGALARCLYGFSLGAVAFRVHAHWLRDRYLSFGIASVLEVIAVVAVIILVTVAGAGPLSLAIPPLFLCVILIFAKQGGWMTGLLLKRIPLMLGKLSFSIYMIHGFIEYRVVNLLEVFDRFTHHRFSMVIHEAGSNHIGGSPLFGDAMSIAFLVLTVACAGITYRFVELPAQFLSRNIVLRDRRVAST